MSIHVENQSKSLVAGTNVTLSSSGNTITIDAGGSGGAILWGLGAGTETATSGTVNFIDSNGISFGMSNSSEVTASYNSLYIQESGNLDGDIFDVSTGTLILAGGSNITISGDSALQVYSIVGNNPLVIEPGGNFVGDFFVASTGTLSLHGGSNITISGDSAASVLSINGPSPGAPLTIRGNQTGGFGNSLSSGSLAFFTSNNIIFGLSLAGGNGTITASATDIPVAASADIKAVDSYTATGILTSRFAAADHIHAGVFSVGVSTGGNTAGDTRVDFGQFVLVGGDNITLSQKTGAGALNTITISGAAGGLGAAIQSISGGTTRVTSGEVVFSNSNGVSFGVDGQTVTGSIATSLSNIRVSAGTTSNLLSAITFSNANNVSFGLDASTITASIATSLTNFRVSAGTTSNLLSALTFSNSNGITFGLDASTITASHSVPIVSNAIQNVGSATGSGTNVSRFAADDHVHAGVPAIAAGSNTGNTLGNTGSQFGTWVVAGTNNITVSGSTGGAGVHTLWLSGTSGGGGGADVSQWENASWKIHGISMTDGRMWVHPFYMPFNISASSAWLMFRVSVGGGTTTTGALSYGLGFYSRNVSTLSLITASSFTSNATWTSGTETSNWGGVTGERLWYASGPYSLTAGNYWVAIWGRRLGTWGSYSMIHAATAAGEFVGRAFEDTASTKQPMLGHGSFSVSLTSAFPESIAFSQLSGEDSRGKMVPWFGLGNFTA